MAGVAGLSTFDPAQTLLIGTGVAAGVFLLGKPWSLRVTAPVVLSVLFVLWAAITQTWTPTPDFTRATVILWAQMIILFIAVLDVVKTRADIRLLATGYLLGAVITVTKNIFLGQGSSLVASAAGRAELGNANVNYVAYALSAGLALVVLLWSSRRSTAVTVLTLVPGAAIVMVGVGASETRAALLSAGMLVAWLALCKILQRVPIHVVVGIIFVLSLLVISGLVDRASLAFESGSRATGDWSGRLIVWPLARDVWADNALAGIGAGAFIQINPMGIGAHNVFLQTGTGMGIIGVGLLLAVFWTALAWKREAVPQRRRALVVGAFLITSAPAYLSGMWETSPASWVALAIIARVPVLGLDQPAASALGHLIRGGRSISPPRSRAMAVTAGNADAGDGNEGSDSSPPLRPDGAASANT